MYTLFDLEDTFGLHVDEINGEFCIWLNRQRPDYADLLEMMKDWYAAWKRDQDNLSSRDEYTDWKLNYPYPMKRRK